MIDQPITIRPEDCWTEEEIRQYLGTYRNDTDFIPEQHWLVRDEKGNLIPHPPR